MKKILIGCMLVISTVSYSAIEAASTFEQLELTFQQLEAEEAAMYNQRKTEAEEAEKVLIPLREKYQKVSENGKVDFSLLYRFFVPNCEIFKTVLPVDFQVKLEFVLMPTKNKKQRINVFP